MNRVTRWRILWILLILWIIMHLFMIVFELIKGEQKDENQKKRKKFEDMATVLRKTH